MLSFMKKKWIMLSSYKPLCHILNCIKRKYSYLYEEKVVKVYQQLPILWRDIEGQIQTVISIYSVFYLSLFPPLSLAYEGIFFYFD